MDSKPFEDLHEILASVNETRVWQFADWIDKAYAPKREDGTWQPMYHKLLYGLTDEAARACAPDTRWVVFTNGDNQYHEHAFRELVEHDASDVVAWDFYSRYYRPTGIPCERFMMNDEAPLCKSNRMQWCHTDLGASAYSWERWIEEDLRFAELKAHGRFTGEDGLLAEEVKARGWAIKHLHGMCLFDQGPNPQMCARLGGVWDDRGAASGNDYGGHCAGQDDLAAALLHDGDTQVIEISLTHDDSLSGFLSYSDADPTTIKCMRPARDHRLMLQSAFGAGCMEQIDEPLMREFMEAKATGTLKMPKVTNARASSVGKKRSPLEWWEKKRYKQPRPAIPKYPADHMPARRKEYLHAEPEADLNTKPPEDLDIHDEL